MLGLQPQLKPFEHQKFISIHYPSRLKEVETYGEKFEGEEAYLKIRVRQINGGKNEKSKDFKSVQFARLAPRKNSLRTQTADCYQ
jgi:hypothetical protein